MLFQINADIKMSLILSDTKITKKLIKYLKGRDFMADLASDENTLSERMRGIRNWRLLED